MNKLKQKQTIHLEKRGHQDLADKVNEIVDYINSKEKREEKSEKLIIPCKQKVIVEENIGKDDWWASVVLCGTAVSLSEQVFCEECKKLRKENKEYAGATLLGLIEKFEDLEEDGANIPPFIYRNIRKFGKKNNLPPFNNK